MIDSKHLAIVNIFAPLKKFTKARFDCTRRKRIIKTIILALIKSLLYQRNKKASSTFCLSNTWQHYKLLFYPWKSVQFSIESRKVLSMIRVAFPTMFRKNSKCQETQVKQLSGQIKKTSYHFDLQVKSKGPVSYRWEKKETKLTTSKKLFQLLVFHTSTHFKISSSWVFPRLPIEF